MKLRFLGQTYIASNNQVKTTISQEKGHFLGRVYSLRRPVKLSQYRKSQLGLKKYRGISYDI